MYQGEYMFVSGRIYVRYRPCLEGYLFLWKFSVIRSSYSGFHHILCIQVQFILLSATTRVNNTINIMKIFTNTPIRIHTNTHTHTHASVRALKYTLTNASKLK